MQAIHSNVMGHILPSFGEVSRMDHKKTAIPKEKSKKTALNWTNVKNYHNDIQTIYLAHRILRVAKGSLLVDANSHLHQPDCISITTLHSFKDCST